MKNLLLIIAFSSVVAWSASRRPTPKILGIRLGMPYDAAHAKLCRIGQFKSEDEGQQVWLLKHDRYYQYVIVGFDGDSKVRYVTVLVRPEGEPVNYEDVGNLATAARFGQPGNLRYTWTLRDKKNHLEYEATAKGKDSRHLDRYSIKRLGLQQAQDTYQDLRAEHDARGHCARSGGILLNSTLAYEMAHFFDHLRGVQPRSPGYHGKPWW